MRLVILKSKLFSQMLFFSMFLVKKTVIINFFPLKEIFSCPRTPKKLFNHIGLAKIRYCKKITHIAHRNVAYVSPAFTANIVIRILIQLCIRYDCSPLWPDYQSYMQMDLHRTWSTHSLANDRNCIKLRQLLHQMLHTHIRDNKMLFLKLHLSPNLIDSLWTLRKDIIHT